uniref:Cyclin N-terminal domain-containing protein n=1 Tax=Octopus bimaculoides TaxID=37653 RepID=A0A0L8GLQ3_OCTBM
MSVSRRNGSGSIFGSPPDIYFQHKITGVTKEILLEWLSSLNDENEKNISDCYPSMGIFKYGEFAEFIFLTCEKFKLSDEVRYLAVELFDRFMNKHTEELYQHILTSVKNKKKKYWHIVQERMQKQILLRISSCCQIASKLTSHYKVIINSQIKNFLSEFDLNYSTESILQSEIRVLKTLNYEVSTASPVTSLEIILEILGFEFPDLDTKILHMISVKIMDLVYLEHKTAYNQLFKRVTGQQQFTESEREKFLSVTNNKMFLVVSLIAAATYIIDKTSTDKVSLNTFIYECIHHTDKTAYLILDVWCNLCVQYYDG